MFGVVRIDRRRLIEPVAQSEQLAAHQSEGRQEQSDNDGYGHARFAPFPPESLRWPDARAAP